MSETDSDDKTDREKFLAEFRCQTTLETFARDDDYVW